MYIYYEWGGSFSRGGYMKKILFVLAMLMLVACAGNRGVSETQISTAPAYVPLSKQPPYDDAAIAASYYTTQLTVLKKGSLEDIKSTDWLRFRKEFLKCKLSKPEKYANSLVEKAMNKMRNEGNLKEASEMAHNILDNNFTSIPSHFTIWSDTTENAETREYHRQVLVSLLTSIGESGRGTSVENAMYVISIGEEYDFLYLNGFNPTGQALIEENGRYFDQMDATDSEGKKYRFIFEVSDFFGHY